MGDLISGSIVFKMWLVFVLYFVYIRMDDIVGGPLVFKNGGVFAPAMPTINCRTCRIRRMKRLMVLDEEEGRLVN